MKKIKHSILYSLGIAMMLTSASSCKKDFLEISPKGKLIAQSTNDYETSLVSLAVLNISSDAQIALGDEIVSLEPYFSGSTLRFQRLFRWEDVIYQRGEDNAEMSVTMENIYLFNKVINEVMQSTGGTEAQKKMVLAQAKVGRAWTYFLLINYFGKPYNPATAATDPGFPIIEKADVTENNFTRASVQEVYDFILNDLNTAVADLPAQITHRIRVSRCAGEGILGKVLLFMRRFNEALPHFDNAFTYMNNATINVGLYDYNVNFAPGGSFLPIGLFGPNFPLSPSFEENILAKQTTTTWAFLSNEVLTSPQTYALYTPEDLRLKCFSGTAYPGGTFPTGLLRRTGPLSKQFGFTVPDLYLLRAEARARVNDLDGAKADVEFLRSKRMPNNVAIPPATASDKNALIKFILDERIREFALLGYRWFDMRRLSVDPDFSNTIGTTHTIYNSQGEVSSTYTLKPERLTLRFSQKVIDLNPKMENNP
ncbi:RagB/SusD family nutrient uptake outer membrane protein [Pseudoflavitalea rhizosphaerae]|uniref:RagB/SusD family nutrient uptake outer membrane protein n=1 Tax=Pseudoflavitalea rhizosphaerae TaxID=1884793 RepID=UPI000F8F1187|nr:RagB/SusD family nutrient uptake outer membrane protein [Pseudoflavitalea rhizosphaerae]